MEEGEREENVIENQDVYKTRVSTKYVRQSNSTVLTTSSALWLVWDPHSFSLMLL